MKASLEKGNLKNRLTVRSVKNYVYRKWNYLSKVISFKENYKQLWIFAQDQAKPIKLQLQHKLGRGLVRRLTEEIKMVNGGWGTERDFSLGVWPPVGFSWASGWPYTYTPMLEAPNGYSEMWRGNRGGVDLG